MESDILPCPFCGGDCDAEQDGWDDDPWQVGCVGKEGAHHCGYRSHYGADVPSAIAAHNAIAAAVRDHAALTAERDALRAQVAQLREALAQFVESAREEAAEDGAGYYCNCDPGNPPCRFCAGAAALAATAPGEEATDGDS